MLVGLILVQMNPMYPNSYTKNNNKIKIKKDTRIEIPFWLAKELVAKKIVSVDLPKNYNPKVIGSLKADATSVSLAASPYFYELGLELANLYVH
jgi:GINS complex subunit 3